MIEKAVLRHPNDSNKMVIAQPNKKTGGGIDEGVPPVLVAADGAARIAKACRCDQELRVFGFDPQS